MQGCLEYRYTRHLSSCLFVGCAHSPRSHSYLCSRGFAPLPSRCILKSIGYKQHFISCQGNQVVSLNSIIVLRNINGYNLIYSTIIQLDKNHLTVNGEQMMLVANINIKVETKTDRLKIIDYGLSPLKTKTEESLLGTIMTSQFIF
ncbi:unnamed protein product [Photorhabdus laumondii subsp. laumondii TTO1]|uniref:Photorhabdus luminescens subsp. laumondii TTO1 complete genome segment 13/17 n=1 Tax=Photorhabdus laumondii subsp. laumondii (strain DSM 15139 / CIP 105565 / TT01) TaxID=243265 RepID=Q7N134_PHOLL|nr:unnamed protein product [Photorhabdus laumondii subsp. laumondii TTO1]